jgi:hypothetical protein
LKEAWDSLKNKVFLIVVGATVIIGGLFLFNKNTAEPDVSQEQMQLQGEEVPVATALNNPPAAAMTATTGTQPPAGNSADARALTDEELQTSYERRLREEGYTDNPQDSYTLIKKYKTKSGKDAYYIQPKNHNDQVTVDLEDRDKKSAQELLESKKSQNPGDELLSLHRLDTNDQNSMMLLGRFRDEASDIELFFSPVMDPQGNLQAQDVICFVAPKLGYDFKRLLTGKVMGDNTGYALLKLNENLFVRAAWSSDKGIRTLSGQIFEVNGDKSKLIKSFEAAERNKKSTSSLKYCE